MFIYRLVIYLLLAALLSQSAHAISDHRAHVWKPQRTLGSAQLTIDQIDSIVCPELESEALDATIEDFVGLIEERYGHRPDIFVRGRPKYGLRLELIDNGLEGGGFTILRKGTRLTVRAAKVEGWCNALYAMMNDMMGARWYWEGALGLEWTKPKRRMFPYRPWTEKPAFVERRLHPVNTDFARRNRLNTVYFFNHNLAKVFTPELYKSQPEVFAEVNGRRKAPRGSGGTDPQPDFTNPQAVEVATQAVLDHFESHPESTSYSLSINDNVLFDTREPTKSVVSPVQYFRGRPNYTDLVFSFMNRVADRVFDQAGAWQTPLGRDRFLTALAYYWTEPAPSFSLHPRIMPVLTSDRAQWHDPDYREEDKALIRAWVASGADRIATWDYYFGAPYLYPRQFNQWIDESIKYLADAGVDVFFSQLPAFWGMDGAKAWLAAELLWDPDQDAEQLLTEFYHAFFGPASAPMRSFYEAVEEHRNVHEGTARWIKLYKDESAIALLTPRLIKEMRAFLGAAERLASGDRRRLARVQVVSEAFRLSELYALYDANRRELVEMCLIPEAGADRSIEAQLKRFRDARNAYQDYEKNYLAGSDYAPGQRKIAFGQSDPEALALHALGRSVTGTFHSMIEDTKLGHQFYVSRNFLGPVLPSLKNWHLDYRPSEDFSVVSSLWAQGAGLHITNTDICSLSKTMPLEEAQDYELRMRAAWQISLDNRVYVHVRWLDSDGRSLLSELPIRLPSGRRSEPVGIQLPLTAPIGAKEVRIRVVNSRQYPGDFLDISELDFGSLH